MVYVSSAVVASLTRCRLYVIDSGRFSILHALLRAYMLAAVSPQLNYNWQAVCDKFDVRAFPV